MDYIIDILSPFKEENYEGALYCARKLKTLQTVSFISQITSYYYTNFI
jgi:hypothetical protein